jgi:hypothetical protein
MSGTAIGQLERAESCPEISTLLVVALALGVPASSLLEGLDRLVLSPSINARDVGLEDELEDEIPF